MTSPLTAAPHTTHRHPRRNSLSPVCAALLRPLPAPAGRGPGAVRGADPLPRSAAPRAAGRDALLGGARRDRPRRGPKPERGGIVSGEGSSAAEGSRSGSHPTVTGRRLRLPDSTALPGTQWIQMSGSITLSTKMPCVRDAVK